MLKELATVQLSCLSGPAFWLELAPNVLFSSQDAIAAAMTALEVKTRAWPAAPDTLTKAQLDVLEAKSHTLLAASRKSARAFIRAEVRVMPGNNEATVLPRFYDSAALHVSSEDNLRMRCVETKQAKRIRAPRLRHEANIPNEIIAYVRAVVRKLVSKGALRNIPSQKSAPPEYACTHTTTHARTDAHTHRCVPRCTHAFRYWKHTSRSRVNNQWDFLASKAAALNFANVYFTCEQLDVTKLGAHIDEA